MKQCLIVIDMQKGIFGLKQEVYQKDELIQNVKTAIRFARDKGIGVIFTQHGNDTFLKSGTEGHQIIDDLQVLPGDEVILKKHPNIFLDTSLDSLLKRDQISLVIILGLISNGCVKDACLSAMHRKYNVILVKDAHSTFYKSAASLIDRVNAEMQKAGAFIVPADGLAMCVT